MLGFPIGVLRGERGVHTRRFVAVGALAVCLAVWGLIVAGAFGPDPRVLTAGLELTAAGVAAACLIDASRRRRPPLGTGSIFFALGALVWFAALIMQVVATGASARTFDGYQVPFVVATAILGVGCWVATGVQQPAAGVAPVVSRGLGVVDGVLIASSVAAWWLLTVWGPLHDGGSTAMVLVTTVVDGAALAGALTLWARTGKAHRPNRAYVLLALGVITVADVAHARGATDADGTLVAFAAFVVGVLLIAASFEVRWASILVRHEVSEVARWAQALLAPTIGVTAIALVAVDHDRHPGGTGHVFVHASVWLVVATLLIRHGLLLIDHVVLNRRLRASTEVLRRLAEHDDLTGLLDRQAFVDVVDAVLADRKADGATGAFVWVHVDGMRRINDLLGTRVGDRTLTQIARRLRDACRASDHLTRYAGDEFVILRPRVGSDTVAWAEDVSAALDDVFDVEGVKIRVTTAIGVLDFEADHHDGASLLSDAASVMGDVRTHGRNRVTVFSLTGDGEDHDVRALARDLRVGLEHKHLRVHYQPICDLETGHVLGAEALLRFEHPARGDVRPDEFLPVAAATGLMPELAMLVLDEACTAFADDPGLGTVSVNLSDADLADPRLLDWVAATLERTGLEPGRLLIELSERVNPEPDVIRGIEALRDLGVELALDDFGSAWTSLAQVQQLPIRVVKIDRWLVEIIASDHEMSDKVRGLLDVVISLADLFDLVVLAEGVETEEQRTACQELGVRLGQGFLWAPALPLTAFVRYVASVGSAELDPRATGPIAR